MNTPLNPLGQQFADALTAVEAHKKRASLSEHGESQPKVHVSGAGRALTFAYEQLRNAAEYTEEHLLLQRAIRRFYKRLFMLRDTARVGSSGEELIIELTLAGYLQNDTVNISDIAAIDKLAGGYFAAYMAHKKDSWTLEVLAVEIERLLNDNLKQRVFIQFAYDHFLQTIDQKKVFSGAVDNYEVALFVAVHRALLKSDAATIRAALLGRYQQTPDAPAYAQTNKMIDKVLESGTTDKLYRLVSRRGAPLRILWRFIEENSDAGDLLKSRDKFLTAYQDQVVTEYEQTESKINKGIIKSVFFLIITKFIVGVALEIPYDYIVHGAIIWLPLAINLLFPPIYMILLRFTLSMPGEANTRTLVDTVDTLLYGDSRTLVLSHRMGKGFGLAFNIVYATLFIAIFGGVALLLWHLQFHLLHILIFFVFLSTASFLGFRLSRQIRELEAVEGQQDGVSMVRDFLYIPFVVVGRWMSEKYARVNIVAMTLDMAIELPLKTVLHLVRQWGAFITSKKDEL